MFNFNVTDKSYLSSFYGFINGFLLLLSGNTINFWLSINGIDLATLSFFSLTALPYSLKYVFSPLIDRCPIPFLSRFYSMRKSWILLCLFCLSIVIFLYGFINPSKNLYEVVLLTLILSFLSACLDIALNSDRIEMSDSKDHYSSSYTFGYRVGILFSGAGLIFLSAYFSWNYLYISSAIFVFILFLYFLFCNSHIAQDKVIPQTKQVNGIIYSLFILPFSHFGKISNLLIVILFICFYRMADNMVDVVRNPFFLGLNFSPVEIAMAGKLFGFTLSITGGLVAGLFINKYGIFNNLIIFGILSGLSNLFYLMITEHNLPIFYLVTAITAFTGGMKMVVYISYMSSLCKGNYVGTQYALLFSIMGVSRVVLPSITGWIINVFDWSLFYGTMTLLSLSSLFILKLMKEEP